MHAAESDANLAWLTYLNRDNSQNFLPLHSFINANSSCCLSRKSHLTSVGIKSSAPQKLLWI